jgi:Tfp pilus assembly protein PilF
MVGSPPAPSLEAALQQAIMHHQARRLAEAERIYRAILQAYPNQVGVYNNLSIALKDQGKLDEAAAVLRRAVTVAPGYATAHSNLGNILYEQGKLAEAEDSYRRAIALKPDMADAHKNLATVLCDRARYTESLPSYRRHADLVYGSPEGAARREQPTSYKARHDQEQREYLKSVGEGAAPPFHVDEGARVAGPAVNPDSSGGVIAGQWQISDPQVAVIDNFLTEEALQALRRFCWRSTVWQKPYAKGYLGAMPYHGFTCPLLVQIDEELRANYPAILGEHPLHHWWGFKYDSKLSGIDIHADFAAVNVNFWITPDDANLDPNGGGLVIWDKPAPLDWNFAHYNGASDAIREFLTKTGSKSMTVPYRGNRAVIFDSDLFHETDRITFKEGYTNRRINITMLYGKREEAAKQQHYQK